MGIKESSSDTVSVRGEWKGAIIPTLVLIILIALPGFIKGLFEPYAGKLMYAYVTGGMLFIAAILGSLAFMAMRDVTSGKTKVFRYVHDYRTEHKDGGARINKNSGKE